MTYTKNENGDLLITLTSVEQNVIINALSEYSRHAFDISKSEEYSDVVHKVYYDFSDAFVSEKAVE